ncbi:MAG: UDP-N-acetylmuramate--L-alanine ligase [Candidatus Tectomicrobia bacterium]|uniref:UDP-N-acetylmuramate--L-alanine ligase n=1 Tax=Tectimicrobiota bacterium TaxID=2528274 RepID=A0A932HXG5_UNCTE|nr:UDP-N-acetylmuramate--L-alanine ligase [Candidatus Tectomicrobia bacterium]
MLRHSQRVHFVGIGGTGMCGIAEVLINLGYAVTGSDLAQNEAVFRLRRLGAKIAMGHRAENVEGVDVVVYSSAVSGENVEVAEARRRKIPVIRRAEMLAELMRMKYSIAVAGAHGKTTTTSLVAAVLAAGGLDPTVVVGGRINAIGSNARLGEGEYLVAEADESDGTFLRLVPTIAVVTNIDEEHLDFYRDFQAIKQAFLEFLNKIPFYGFSVVCLDHPAVQEIIPGIEKRFFTYGFGSQADYIGEDFHYESGEAVFSVRRRNERLGELRLRIPGRHNAYNALAAVAVASELDVPFEAVQRGLHGFDGIGRRLERIGEAAGVAVLDDYGHHPEEIRATLRAVREAWPDRRLVVLFQPHRYSRTLHLGKAFHTAFYDADLLLVAPIYAAGEAPIPGVSASAIAEGARAHGHKACEEVEGVHEAAGRLAEAVRPGDLVLTLGAGDVWKAGRELLERLAPGEKREEEAG